MDPIQEIKSSKAIVAVCITVVAILVLQRVFRTTPDPREPPVIQPRVPFIGHIIGLIRNGAKYFEIVSARCNAPIFTLPMLTSRTYIVTSPVLASQVQRASKTLQFNPLIIEVTNRMQGFRHPTTREKLHAQDTAFMDRLHEMTYAVLSPPEITSISKTVLKKVTDLVGKTGDGFETELSGWVRNILAVATTATFYGPENPFTLRPELIEIFWEYEAGLVGIIASPFPWLTSRRAYKGRELCVQALVEYFKKEGWRNAAFFIQERHRLHSDIALDKEDEARGELGMMFGMLANAGVTIFWVLNNIFSRPGLLQELREEVTKNAVSTDISNKMEKRTISFEAIKAKCALLNSVYRETLRIIAPMASARLVTEDTILHDTWLLRKGSVVQIAGGVLHHDAETWGPDFNEFNPRRFLTSQYGTRTGGPSSPGEKNQVHPAAYRAFGGGTVFCPGRHFAQVEILSLVALLILKFDLEVPKGASKINFDPPMYEKTMPLTVLKPVEEVRVRMMEREPEVEWEVTL